MSPLIASYRVELPRSVLVLGGAAMVLLSAAGLALLALALGSPTSPGWLLAFAVLWISGVILIGKQALAFPTRLELGSDGVLRFVCPTRIVKVPLATIRSMKPGPLGLLVVTHDHGSVRLAARPAGLEDLLSRVRAASTRAVIVGL